MFRAIEARLLTDARATRREILGGLTWLRRQKTQEGVAVVFFSGHGRRDTEGDLFLLPVDVDTADLLATPWPTPTHEGARGDAGPGHRGLGSLPRRGRRGRPPQGLPRPDRELVRDLVTDDYGMIVMASSMGRESSPESDATRQGDFTQALTEGLAGRADPSLGLPCDDGGNGATFPDVPSLVFRSSRVISRR